MDGVDHPAGPPARSRRAIRPTRVDTGRYDPSRAPAAIRAPSDARSVTIRMAIRPITSQAPEDWITTVLALHAPAPDREREAHQHQQLEDVLGEQVGVADRGVEQRQLPAGEQPLQHHGHGAQADHQEAVEDQQVVETRERVVEHLLLAEGVDQQVLEPLLRGDRIGRLDRPTLSSWNRRLSEITTAADADDRQDPEPDDSGDCRETTLRWRGAWELLLGEMKRQAHAGQYIKENEWSFMLNFIM